MGLRVRRTDAGVVIAVKVVPGSARMGVAGVHDGALKVKVAAAPERGKANKELTAFLAKLLGVSKSAVGVVSGEHNSHKEVQVAGLTDEELLRRLASFLS